MPVAEIEQLLLERPDAIGIAVAGMPAGSPGMEIEGIAAEPFDVILFNEEGENEVFATYPK